ncbi:type VI secretion system tip protein VgrG [Lelliottia aquatilis]|nr:type VI secretion system tip protein VgrG [Lelliottia aquatilis]
MTVSTGLRFTARIGDLPAFTFSVVDFALKETFNTPFELTLRLASHQPDIDFGAVLDKPAELEITYNGQLQRRVSGIVGRFEQGDTGFQRTRYEARIYPALWRAGLRDNCRIFQLKTPQEIIGTLLKEAGVTEYDFSLRDEHLPREYCVQYRESDLDFIRRLAAEEGMFFWYASEDDTQRLIFSDHQASLAKENPLFFSADRHGLEEGAYVHALSYREAVKTARVELRDYSFKTPVNSQSHKKQGSDLAHQREQYEHYDYPGRYKGEPHGKAFSRYRLEGLRAEAVSAEGGSNCAGLRPGIRFELTQHRNPEFNALWQVISAVHTGKQPAALEEESGDQPTTFDNIFTVVRGETGTFWRPVQQVRPVMDGPQIAIVTGPDTEEIYCDEHGRVKVRFPWDREGRGDGLSSCWLRVSQNWAGGRYGAVTLPRVGHEVVVDFLDGDPDRPLITGRTYHAVNQPPYPLPLNKNRMVLRSDSIHGKGYNELSFEDTAGSEEVLLRAQKNMAIRVLNSKDERVEYNRTSIIGHDEALVVANNRTVTVEGNQHQQISGNNLLRTEGDHGITVQGDLAQKIAGVFSVDSQGDLTLQSLNKLTLRVGSSFIVLHDGGADMKGATINLNSGGSPGDLSIPADPMLMKAAAAQGAMFVEHLPAPPEQHAQAAKKHLPEPVDAGFCVVPASGSVSGYESLIFESPPEGVTDLYRTLNGGGDIKAGSVLLVADPGKQDADQIAHMKAAKSRIDAALAPLSPDQANFLYRHKDAIAMFAAASDTASETVEQAGRVAEAAKGYFEQVEKILKQIQTAYKNQYLTSGSLISEEFFVERQRLFGQLDGVLKMFMKQRFMFNEYTHLKSALGLSSKAITHRWNETGIDDIEGYATHIEKAAKYVKLMETAGKIGLGLSALNTAAEITEACSTGRDCEKTAFTSVGEFSGGQVGGAIAGKIADSAAANTVCALVLGAATVEAGGAGALLCTLGVNGAIAYGSDKVFSWGGEFIGDKIYEATSND